MGSATPPAPVGTYGDCSGSVKAEWLDDGRRMKLLAEYTYVDRSAKHWDAPAGAVVDGASIPQFLWSFIGGPFEGRYRKASVTHDVECARETEDWRAVHRMFFDAMRCSEVTVVRATIIYAAVYHCGPRWGANQGVRLLPCGKEPNASLVRQLSRYVRQHPDLSLEEIATINSDTLSTISGTSPVDALRQLSAALKVDEGFEGFVVTVAHFAPGEADASPTAAEALRQAAVILKETPNLEYTVIGYTDSTGDAVDNMRLSQKRAAHVVGALTAFGVDRSSIHSMGYGESPVQSDYTAEGRSANRRVEIVVRELD
jgi:outer membrane protein OmpA-like peptidoglycan-associated protein